MGRNSLARAALLAPLVVSGLLVAGCVSSPTYGTGKTANAQLTSDLSGMFSMKPKRTVVPDYKPRPELVQPASTAELPLPQDSVTEVSPAWPESPEQKRARLLAETTATRDDPGFEPLVIDDTLGETVKRKPRNMPALSDRQSAAAQPMPHSEAVARRAEYNRRLAEKNSSPTQRKLLSEPPLEYRVPAATAPVNDVGEDEAKKQRRIKRAATKGGGWRDLVPWL